MDGGTCEGLTIWWLEEADGLHLSRINPHFACPKGQPCYSVSIAEFNTRSHFAQYTTGFKRGRVTLHGDSGDHEHLKITGKPPRVFSALHDEVLETQRTQSVAPVEGRDVDHVFDLPAQLGAHFFGFRYGRLPEMGMVQRCAKVLGPRVEPDPKRPFWRELWKL